MMQGPAISKVVQRRKSKRHASIRSQKKDVQNSVLNNLQKSLMQGPAISKVVQRRKSKRHASIRSQKKDVQNSVLNNLQKSLMQGPAISKVVQRRKSKRHASIRSQKKDVQNSVLNNLQKSLMQGPAISKVVQRRKSERRASIRTQKKDVQNAVLNNLQKSLLNQKYITEQIRNLNVFLYQLLPFHDEAIDTVNLLKEKLLFLLYCLKKSVHQRKQGENGLSDELKKLFKDLLFQPNFDKLPIVKYASVKFDESLMEFIGDTISFKNTVHVMCEFLGLAPELRDNFKKIEEEFQYHIPYEGWIKKLFYDNYCDLSINAEEDLASSLMKLGYTEEKSNIIASLVPEDLRQVHSPYFWALRYLDYSFYNEGLLLEIPKFHFQSDMVNEWFKQYCSYDDDGNSCKEVKMINLSSKKVEEEKVLPLLVESEDCVFLYHGTTYQSCLNLIRNGIKLGRGSANQDFSSRKGFYLSEDLEEAKRWGSAGRGDTYAVLVYKVSRDFMDAEQQHGLNLTDYDQWNSVVKYCRSGYKVKLDSSISLENVSFIRGPTAAGKAFTNSHLGGNFQMGDSTQICIRDQKFATKFGDFHNVFFALFF
ncbi:uncharacterized protein LOC131947469 [Physella acuta]|uniref:uncharacterized protein LOC131947469 n=1 Tax=Physella acuta TaxID=109671 RepID=UPI0027DCB996|nr:uncharacterized protein LOC131947469 [Physella acuta]